MLDEADEMLDLGFLPDIERILRQIPADRQSMLFSATMPDPIITLARTFMDQPTHIRAEAPHSAATHDTTEQFVYRAHALDKVDKLKKTIAGLNDMASPCSINRKHARLCKATWLNALAWP